jgi:hypothetical protein
VSCKEACHITMNVTIIRSCNMKSLGGSSPLYAFTSITNDIRCKDKHNKFYYGVKSQVDDNMFRPFFSVLIRPSSGQTW